MKQNDYKAHQIIVRIMYKRCTRFKLTERQGQKGKDVCSDRKLFVTSNILMKHQSPSTYH
jgi:hypothetical protein